MSADPETIPILIVDDDPAVGLMGEAALSAAGYGVHLAHNGEAALERFAAVHPRLVILDVVMPGMDGFDTCAALRALPEGAEIPILMATGLEDMGSIDKAYQAGATDFVTKPINWPLLRHRLRYLLRASQMRDELAQSRQRYALAAAGANDGLWDWDILEDRAYFSPRWGEILGLLAEEIGDQISTWLERIHPDDLPYVHAALIAHMSGDSPHFRAEFRMRETGGGYRWVLVRGMAVRDAQGIVHRMAGSMSDIADRKLAEERLVHDALHDALTGLPNRRLFCERVAHCIAIQRRRPEYRFAVCFLDLDRFKNVNDSLGHQAGDQLLRQVSERIRQRLRASDTLSRLGGDEFAILFDDLRDLTPLYQAVERIQEALRAPLSVGGEELTLSASMGIAVSGPGYNRPEEMLRDADTAMYRAKHRGRARYELFTDAMHLEVSQVLRLENELRRALVRHEFQVEYQPILVFPEEHIVGFEALLRWRHPARGLLAPADFLEIAEESGLILDIGPWVLRTACAQLQAWRGADPRLQEAFVSVNLSSQEFAQAGLPATVAEVLTATGLPGTQLKLEVTERVLIDNPTQAEATLEQLHAMGIQLAIDDFGTGYSSFSYLHRFPFDLLKIDRSFVQAIGEDPAKQKIVRTIVELAHNLGLSVVAEGFEDAAAMAQIKRLGCEFGQGFHFAAPGGPAEIEALLRPGNSVRVPPETEGGLP